MIIYSSVYLLFCFSIFLLVCVFIAPYICFSEEMFVYLQTLMRKCVFASLGECVNIYLCVCGDGIVQKETVETKENKRSVGSQLLWKKAKKAAKI